MAEFPERKYRVNSKEEMSPKTLPVVEWFKYLNFFFFYDRTMA